MKIRTRHIIENTLTDLPDYMQIEIGDGSKRITISVRDEMVTVSADGRIAIWPRAANLIHVEGGH